jgi:hypothetical protein
MLFTGPINPARNCNGQAGRPPIDTRPGQMNGGGILIFLAVAALIIVATIFSAIAARRRREAMQALAVRLGLRFSEANDYNLAGRFGFLDQLAQGSNRYAFNVLSGPYRQNEVLAFDYHYETHSTDSKGHSQTHHHYFSFFILSLPASFPELRITREGLFSKIAQAFGYDDIDFESAEFSKMFCVRSRDKRFAYDVCHAQMIEYLLANPDLSVELENHALALAFDRQLEAPQVESNLNRLVQIRSRLPEYLFTKT